jgi:hypothetical protein
VGRMRATLSTWVGKRIQTINILLLPYKVLYYNIT